MCTITQNPGGHEFLEGDIINLRNAGNCQYDEQATFLSTTQQYSEYYGMRI